MHHSNDRDRQSAVLACYVDDSGTDNQSPLVVLGACVLDRDAFIRFDKSWRKMLDQYRIESLHMADFVRPHGKHIGIYPELKIALFRQVASIINRRKDSSFSILVSNAEFKKAIPHDMQGATIGPYAAAFIGLALMNSKIANVRDYPDKIAYLVDEGSSVAEQLRIGHLLVKGFEKAQSQKVRTGSFAFADDEDVSALQAADVIAWSARRKFSGDGLANEFAALNNIFSKRFNSQGVEVHPHFHHQLQDDLAQRIMEQITADGPAMHKRALEAIQSVIGDG